MVGSYPSTDQIESADRVQLARWFRFLPSPGINHVNSFSGYEAWLVKMEEEAKKMDRICERFKESGGWSPEISKQIGWG